MRLSGISLASAAAVALAMSARPEEILIGGNDYLGYGYGRPTPPFLLRDPGPHPEQPAEYGRRGRRNPHWGSKRYAGRRYKGSAAAKRATRRGGNPAAQR